METKSRMPWVPALAALTFLLAAGAARAQQAVTPGRSVGRVFLGMPRGDVWKLLQKPTRSRVLPPSQLPAPHPPGGYTLDEWEGGTHSVKILCRDTKVVQVEVNSPQFTLPGGVSVDTTFAVVRRRFPRMRVDQYLGTVVGQEKSGEVFFCVDDVRQGIAFTQYPDTATFDDLPRLTPDSLIVHLPGQRALPVDADPHGILKTEPHAKEDDLPEMRAWFAGGPRRSTTKGSH